MNAVAISARVVRRKRLLWNLFVMVALGGTVGCAPFAAVSESLFMMSPTQEVEFGAKVKDEVAKQYKLVQDPEVVGYVRDLGTKVWLKSPQSPFKAEFNVVADKSINAFAIPGGSVYVNSGLIDAAGDEAELAAVIAHELGHVVERHSARQVSRQTGMAAIEQIALGQDAGQATQLISSLLSQGIMFRYSRADEQQADRIALGTLDRMGYDPTAMMTFFDKLLKKYPDQGGPVSTLFASHPPTAERIADAKAIIQTLPPRQYVRPVTDLRRIQGRLDQLGLGAK
ncbi:MAG: M48 family metallopeptidase [bacterium]|nr:M48 family metallopeptidase [bacterium]